MSTQNTTGRSRQPKGVSTGGQFAAAHRAEATGLSLSPASGLGGSEDELLAWAPPEKLPRLTDLCKVEHNGFSTIMSVPKANRAHLAAAFGLEAEPLRIVEEPSEAGDDYESYQDGVELSFYGLRNTLLGTRQYRGNQSDAEIGRDLVQAPDWRQVAAATEARAEQAGIPAWMDLSVRGESWAVTARVLSDDGETVRIRRRRRDSGQGEEQALRAEDIRWASRAEAIRREPILAWANGHGTAAPAYQDRMARLLGRQAERARALGADTWIATHADPNTDQGQEQIAVWQQIAPARVQDRPDGVGTEHQVRFRLADLDEDKARALYEAGAYFGNEAPHDVATTRVHQYDHRPSDDELRADAAALVQTYWPGTDTGRHGRKLTSEQLTAKQVHSPDEHEMFELMVEHRDALRGGD